MMAGDKISSIAATFATDGVVLAWSLEAMVAGALVH
jgi:hypothetical protein